MSTVESLNEIRRELPAGVALVAVSKTHPPEAVMELYTGAGQRAFGESRPQELKAKYEALPKDIEWHMIGNLQTNKVKYIAPFVKLIHSVDSDKLLAVIDREAKKNGRTIDVLLEVHVAGEESKIGWEEQELAEYLKTEAHKAYGNVSIRGLMAIASLTEDAGQQEREFKRVRFLFDELKEFTGPLFDTLSLGMTSDYRVAVRCGSTMVRIGSLIFGERDYSKV